MSKLKVLLQPTTRQIGLDNGVGQVLANHQRYFREVDIEVVDEDALSYDLSASHLGFNINADVHHNHGLWLGGLGDDRAKQNRDIVESVRRAKQVIVPSDYVARYFRRDMRLDPNVIGHGVNWDEWQGGESKGYVLWDKNRKSTICDPEPVTILASAFHDVPFVSTFIETRPPNVYVTGRIPFNKMRQIVLGTHIYLGTTKETFGIGTLQAMAAGAPVVGYDWGGTADIVRNGIDGILVRPGDSEALKQALSEVLKRRDEMGANARERAKCFTWLEVVKRIRSVYERALRNDEPTVSVIIPSYNYAEVLPRAVKSVMDQTYDRVKEIIIVDDGSTDNTPDVGRKLAQIDQRIIYIRQTNGGVANARNTGIDHATSKYVCCLDADDEIKPTYLETMVGALEEDRGIRLAYSKIEGVHPNSDRSISKWPGEFDADAMLHGKNQVPTCCVYYKEDWQRLGGYKQRYCPKGFGAEDAEFWLRFAKHGYRAKLVTDEPLFVYHFGGNTSKDYVEPRWHAWHTDLKTGWLPFAALSDDEIHGVTDYDQPVYSVIIPVGPGHEHYLEDALDSVEAQTDKRWECIVVWNMPPSGLVTNPVVDRLHFAYPFVKFVLANERQGAGYARNVGAQHSKGQYLVFLDADDYLQPRFLELTRKALEYYHADWVYTDLYTQTEEGIKTFECYSWDVERLWRHGIMGVTCLYPRTAYDKVGGFDEENNREDWDFHLRLARAGLCGLHLGAPLFTYRQQLGFRREYRKVARSAEESKAMKIEDVKRLHELYDVGELKMACGGCSNNRIEIKTATEGDMETMIYTGRNPQMANEVTFRGPITGERYRTIQGRIMNVHPQDADAFEQRQMFKRVPKLQKQEPIESATPKQPEVEEVTRQQEIERVNASAMQAKNEAREETERMMREMFGDAFIEEPHTTSTAAESWYANPSERTVEDNETLILQNNPTADQLQMMREAEVNGKNRVTLLRIIDDHLENAQ